MAIKVSLLPKMTATQQTNSSAGRGTPFPHSSVSEINVFISAVAEKKLSDELLLPQPYRHHQCCEAQEVIGSFCVPFSQFQFWGADKDPSRLDAGVFEDLNRFCWSQQQQQHHHQHHSQMTQAGANANNGSISGFPSSTDGQIYTLTVLNGSEQWLKKEMAESTSLPLDLDTLLGGFPGYIKSEYSYEDSGFGTENNKSDDLLMSHHHHNSQHSVQHLQPPHLLGQPQQQHPHSPLPTSVSGNPNSSTNLGAFQDSGVAAAGNTSTTCSSNNSSTGTTNDWQLTDHNHNTEVRPVMSLLNISLALLYARLVRGPTWLSDLITSNRRVIIIN